MSLQPDDKKKKYNQLKDLNEHLLKQLEQGQQQLDQLNMKKAELEEVSLSWSSLLLVSVYDQCGWQTLPMLKVIVIDSIMVMRY